MRRIRVAIILCIAVFMLAGCSQKGIIGSWQHDAKNAQYTFNEDKTFEIVVDGQEARKGTFEIDDEKNMIILTYNGLSQTSEYAIKKKQLVLTSPDSGSVVTMTRIKKK